MAKNFLETFPCAERFLRKRFECSWLPVDAGGLGVELLR